MINANRRTNYAPEPVWEAIARHFPGSSVQTTSNGAKLGQTSERVTESFDFAMSSRFSTIKGTLLWER